jgi:thiol:disulfide interchange protein DsbC
MLKLFGSSLAVLALLLGLVATAAADPAVEKSIRDALATSRPDLAISSVEPSPVPGIYAVQFTDGPVVYATADGSHFFLGDLFSVEAGGFVNLAERERDALRAELLKEVEPGKTIAFKSSGKPRAVVHVFTDVDCFYCQLLHQQIAEYNKLGIEVRYLAYPRAGIGSDSYNKIASAWCARNRQEALTQLKSRQSIPNNVCADNPVAEQFELGNRMGVEGTPAIITASGQLLPGFLPPAQLAQALGLTE